MAQLRSSMKHIWLSCHRFTVSIDVDDSPEQRITRAAPFVRRFIGQPLGNLRRWASGFGQVTVIKNSAITGQSTSQCK